jgi:hypothetical protein
LSAHTFCRGKSAYILFQLDFKKENEARLTPQVTALLQRKKREKRKKEKALSAKAALISDVHVTVYDTSYLHCIFL